MAHYPLTTVCDVTEKDTKVHTTNIAGPCCVLPRNWWMFRKAATAGFDLELKSLLKDYDDDQAYGVDVELSESDPNSAKISVRAVQGPHNHYKIALACIDILHKHGLEITDLPVHVSAEGTIFSVRR